MVLSSMAFAAPGVAFALALSARFYSKVFVIHGFLTTAQSSVAGFVRRYALPTPGSLQ